MKIAKRFVRSDDRIVIPEANGDSRTSVLRLRLLVDDLLSELELLDEQSLSFSPSSLLDSRDSVNFYEEVERFESALIKSPLRPTNGHQINAARVLQLNPSTLNAKIKQYLIRHKYPGSHRVRRVQKTRARE